MQSFLNVITLQTYTFFTTLTPRLHGRRKRFFRRPQNLNAPRICPLTYLPTYYPNTYLPYLPILPYYPPTQYLNIYLPHQPPTYPHTYLPTHPSFHACIDLFVHPSVLQSITTMLMMNTTQPLPYSGTTKHISCKAIKSRTKRWAEFVTRTCRSDVHAKWETCREQQRTGKTQVQAGEWYQRKWPTNRM